MPRADHCGNSRKARIELVASGGNQKGRLAAALPVHHVANEPLRAYFSAVETDEKVVFRLVPRACTVAMMATEIPAAIRPYSMAVAPD